MVTSLRSWKDAPLPSIPEALRALRSRTLSAAELMESCLAHVRDREETVHAFAWLDEARARRLAAEADQRRAAGNPAGPLDGIPVGIKDIVDTAGIPTEHGCAYYAGRVPDQSADLAAALERAGALLMGKTVTTEVAYFHPGPTRNPWDPSRTSGGSSMGSAAGVAAGMFLGAVGTQTNGSVIRPAAFCGVVGFKPSAGRISRAGVLPFSQHLDQMGCFARSVEGTALLAAAMAGEPATGWLAAEDGPGGAPPRLAAVRTADWEHAEPAQRARFEASVTALAASGAHVSWPALPDGLDECLPVHRTIMAYEGAANFGAVASAQPDKFSATLRRFLEEGAAIPAARYQDALREQARLAGAFAAWMGDYDAVLTPPATGEAPTPETTGDPRFCTRWTLVGAPALTLPVALGPHGLPLSVQVVGRPGEDSGLLRAAAWIEQALPACW